MLSPVVAAWLASPFTPMRYTCTGQGGRGTQAAAVQFPKPSAPGSAAPVQAR